MRVELPDGARCTQCENPISGSFFLVQECFRLPDLVEDEAHWFCSHFCLMRWIATVYKTTTAEPDEGVGA